jgi:NAD(P)-dependent dehydrogenase (short-subunit alcohol dehydrogenase family)
MSSSKAWSTADIPDQSGRLAVVTGGNSGIGFEAAKALAIAGADVILAVRSASKGDAAVAEILAAAPTATVTHEALDLSDQASVGAFAQGRIENGRPIDLLINNGGIMAVPERTLTTDGFELQLGTNFFGHYALTGRLLDLVLAAPGVPRVVTVTSTAADTGKINLDDLQLEHGYGAWKAYMQSKLATSMLSVELARRAAGTKLLSTSAHPGFAKSNLQTTGPLHGKSGGFSITKLATSLPFVSQDSAGGALPTLRAAVDPQAKQGDYFEPSRLRMTGPPKLGKHPKRVHDQPTIDGLFTQAEQLTGVAWPAAAELAQA